MQLSKLFGRTPADNRCSYNSLSQTSCVSYTSHGISTCTLLSVNTSTMSMWPAKLARWSGVRCPCITGGSFTLQFWDLIAVPASHYWLYTIEVKSQYIILVLTTPFHSFKAHKNIWEGSWIMWSNDNVWMLFGILLQIPPSKSELWDGSCLSI